MQMHGKIGSTKSLVFQRTSLFKSLCYCMTNGAQRRTNYHFNKMPPKRPKRKNMSVWKRIRHHFVFCANICSVHGFAHIVRRNISPFERLLWFLLVTSAAGWCIELGLQAWDRYQIRPTVISLERDHWKWNSTFPSATFCLTAIDDTRADELISELETPLENDTDKFKNFLRYLVTSDFAFMEDYVNDSLYQNVDKYVEWALKSSATLDSPVIIRQEFGELQQFQTILTEFGVCFTHNSAIAIYNTPEYWAKGTNKQADVGMINPTMATPTVFVQNLMSGYKIFFHGPNELPNRNMKGVTVEAGTYATFELITNAIWTPPEVKSLNIRQRDCRLLEESNLEHSPVYSYNLCRSECRTRLAKEKCNCIPFTFKPRENEKICNPSGMHCIMKNLALVKHLNYKSGKAACSCLQACDTVVVTINKFEETGWFMGTNIEWKVKKFPTIRYKRSLIFSQTDLLVQIGGVAGLFLGFSILSLIELLFFVTMRFYWGVIRGRTID